MGSGEFIVASLSSVPTSVFCLVVFRAADPRARGLQNFPDGNFRVIGRELVQLREVGRFGEYAAACRAGWAGGDVTCPPVAGTLE